MMIIDFHTHVPPRRDWTFFLTQCRDNGVDLAVTSSLGTHGWPHYPEEDSVHAANDDARAFAEFSGGRVIWFAYLNPNHESWGRELDRCVSAGARGIKLWTSLKDPETGDSACVHPVLDAASRAGLPVLIHTFHRTDPNLPGEITVAEFAELARAHPGTTLIAAHAGGNWRQCLGLLGNLPNTFVDVCGFYPETGMVEALAADLGPDRVLYGSDALGRSIPSQIAKVTLASLSAEAKEEILWRNSARVLGMTAEEIQTAGARATRLPDTVGLPLPPLDEDHFCYCGSWPFRDDPHATPAALNEALAKHRIRRAHTACARTVYALEAMSANRRFATEAEGCSRIVPLASLLPFAPNWEAILADACRHFRGGIVFPYLHDWRLDDPRYGPFFSACAAAGLPLWINCCTADLRCRHRGTVCRPVSTPELLSFLEAAPPNGYVFQGMSAPGVHQALREIRRPDCRFDISRLSDNSSALRDTVRECGVERLVLGTEFPFRDLRQVSSTTEMLCRGKRD